MKYLRLTLKILMPLVVLVLGGFVVKAILSNQRAPIVRAPDDAGPLVRVQVVHTEQLQLDVVARGSVEPLRTVELAAEVSGRIVRTSDSLRPGGTFTPNDVLVVIDDTDYRLAIAQQESAVARAELRLLQERAEGQSAERAWRELNGDDPADPLVRREPQIKDARLAVEAAEALLQKARTDLVRCQVQLPFDGRVQSVVADIGQTVQRGQRLATVFDTTALEVRLPIPVADAAFLDLPLTESTDDGPTVKLHTDFAGRQRTYPARIVRVEGEVDRRTRQLTAVARVAGDAEGDAGAPLLVGMFVEAEIHGRSIEGVIAVPAAAMHGADEVWVVGPSIVGFDVTAIGVLPRVGFRLASRRIEVLRVERDRVLTSGGLQDGDVVCVSALEAPVAGMTVRVARPTADGNNPLEK